MPPFKTLDEEAEFWDTHDTSLLMKDPSTPLDKLPLIETEKVDTITLRLQKSVKSRLQAIAKRKGINTSTLSRMWLIEKVNEFEHQAL